MIQSPQNSRIKNRRKEQDKWRRTKRWKKLVEDHAHAPGEVCVHCKRKHGDIKYSKGKPRFNKNGKPMTVYLTINHITRARYVSEELYCTWDETDMEICCTDCNWRIEHGEKRCPICHGTYIHWRDYCCQECWDKTHPVEAQKRVDEAERKKRELSELKKRIKADKKAKAQRWKIDNPYNPMQSRLGS